MFNAGGLEEGILLFCKRKRATPSRLQPRLEAGKPVADAACPGGCPLLVNRAIVDVLALIRRMYEQGGPTMSGLIARVG